MVVLTYKFQAHEIKNINKHLNYNLADQLSFTVNHTYNNTRTIGLDVLETPYIQHLVSHASLPTDIARSARPPLRSLR